MDNQPQAQVINPNDLVIFQNIDNEDHEWFHNTTVTPLPYYIRRGETRELPFYIATHGIEKLIDKMLQKQDKIHTSPLFRDELRKKIVLGLKHINYIREKTPNEIALEAMQRKKDTNPYLEIFKEREIEVERQEKERQMALQPKAPLIQTIGTPLAPTTQQVSNPQTAASPTQTALNNIDAPQAIADPQRQEVYTALQTKLHLDLNHIPTKEKFDSMTVEALKQEFASQIPEFGPPTPAKPLGIQGGVPLTPQGQSRIEVPPTLRPQGNELDKQLENAAPTITAL